MSLFFFFNDTATTEIYTLSLHDALPILLELDWQLCIQLDSVFISVQVQVLLFLFIFLFAIIILFRCIILDGFHVLERKDRKSTRLNSSHLGISYAVFCLRKKTALPHTLR